MQQTVAHGVIIDWEYTSPGPLRLILALAMLVVTLAVAGRRIAWLVRLIRSGKKAEGRTDNIEQRVKDQVLEVLRPAQLLSGRRRASPTSSPSGASSSSA